MRNIFLFIRRYFNFLFFLFLQGCCIYFISSYSSYHHAAMGNFRNQFTGRLNERYSSLSSYFELKRKNAELAKANEMLMNRIQTVSAPPDSIQKNFTDSTGADTLKKSRILLFKHARVISNSVSLPNNFFVLSGGANKGFKAGMGVVDPLNGVAGIVVEVSEDYSAVMSMLHRDCRVSGKLKRTGETGIISWDGKRANLVSMSNVSKAAKIYKGDTVISSGFSTTFPKGMMIGTVEGVFTVRGSNNYLLKIRTSADFHDLEHVYVVENPDQQAVEDILGKVSVQQ
jgi:rod shape-determining protein MreC